jgi:hypothetical protein
MEGDMYFGDTTQTAPSQTQRAAPMYLLFAIGIGFAAYAMAKVKA